MELELGTGRIEHDSDGQGAAGCGRVGRDSCKPTVSQRMSALTQKQVAAATVGAGQRTRLSDGLVPGLQVRVGSTKKSFVLFYRNARGQMRMLTLGDFPNLSLADARERARDVLASVRFDGADPQAEKVATRADGAAPTFVRLAEMFLETKHHRHAARTHTEYARMVKAYISAHAVGEMPAPDIRRPHLRALLESVAEKHGNVMANRLFQLVRAVCRWAARQDAPGRAGEVRSLLETNPAYGLERPREETPKERALSDREIVALWRAADAARPAVAAYARCLVLLGQRPDETLAMRWADVDLEHGRWDVPGEFRKGGRSHAVPLPRLVIDLLRALPQTAPRVFSLDRHNWLRWWEPLRSAAVAGGAEHFTRHDLRRTCATGCARLGASSEIVSRILGHKAVHGTIAVTGIYDRYDRIEERRAALEKWAQHVATVTGMAGADA